MVLNTDQIAALENLASDIVKESSIVGTLQSLILDKLDAILPLESSMFADAKQLIQSTLLRLICDTTSAALNTVELQNTERLAVVQKALERAYQVAQHHVEESFTLLKSAAAGSDEDIMCTYCEDVKLAAIDMGKSSVDEPDKVFGSGSGLVQSMVREWHQAVLRFGDQRVLELGLLLSSRPQSSQPNTDNNHSDGLQDAQVDTMQDEQMSIAVNTVERGTATPTSANGPKRNHAQQSKQTQNDGSDGEEHDIAEQHKSKRIRTRSSFVETNNTMTTIGVTGQPICNKEVNQREKSERRREHAKVFNVSNHANQITQKNRPSAIKGEGNAGAPTTAAPSTPGRGRRKRRGGGAEGERKNKKGKMKVGSRLAQVKDRAQAALAARVATRVQQLSKRKQRQPGTTQK